MRPVAVAAVLLCCAACADDQERPSRAAPTTMRLDWREVASLQAGQFVFEVERLFIREQGWTVEAAIENRTSMTYIVTRPHVRGGTKTGLLIGKVTLLANRFEPALPRVFEPGRRWSGRFSGTRRLPQGQRLRVSFGLFFNGASRPAYFQWITDHSVSL